MNEAKTEEYVIKSGGKDDWKTCKYLGSMLDSEKDINRQKQLSMASFHKYKYILQSKKLSLEVRICLFNAYVTSIFMYNSEIWTLTKKMEEDINIFQRKLLRKILKIRWPHVISNEELYSRTSESNWSEVIKQRRLRWLGHLLRLPIDSPARVALNEFNIKCKRKRGRSKLTWIELVNNDFNIINKDFSVNSESILNLAADREMWRRVVVYGLPAMSTSDVQQPE